MLDLENLAYTLWPLSIELAPVGFISQAILEIQVKKACL
jgi:hypothetical protein